jgi:hypothetical protein
MLRRSLTGSSRTHALRAFQPRMDQTWRDDRVAPTESLVVPTRALPRPVRLFEACAFELYNHIAAQAEYKICANESCRRLFVNQERLSSTNRKSRWDAKYHTRACANAQAQRAWRRRAAANLVGSARK